MIVYQENIKAKADHRIYQPEDLKLELSDLIKGKSEVDDLRKAFKTFSQHKVNTIQDEIVYHQYLSIDSDMEDISRADEEFVVITLERRVVTPWSVAEGDIDTRNTYSVQLSFFFIKEKKDEPKQRSLLRHWLHAEGFQSQTLPYKTPREQEKADKAFDAISSTHRFSHFRLNVANGIF